MYRQIICVYLGIVQHNPVIMVDVKHTNKLKKTEYFPAPNIWLKMTPKNKLPLQYVIDKQGDMDDRWETKCIKEEMWRAVWGR